LTVDTDFHSRYCFGGRS